MVSFFDEDDLLIQRSVAGLAMLGARAIVAVDGPYSLYPDKEPRSSDAQIETLQRAADRHHVFLHLYQRDISWIGNEVQKRQMMLDLSLLVARAGDWLAIWDCDYRLVSAPSTAKIDVALHYTDRDVATIDFTEDPNASEPDYYPMGMLLRAQPGISMDGNHHTYLLPDGRRTHVLRRPVPNEAEALHLPDIKILHDVHQRDPERRAKQTAYYERRDGLGVEL